MEKITRYTEEALEKMNEAHQHVLKYICRRPLVKRNG